MTGRGKDFKRSIEYFKEGFFQLLKLSLSMKNPFELSLLQ